jgi:hypothetical protein
MCGGGFQIQPGMLTIRAEQFRFFQGATVSSEVAAMRAHLRRHFPTHTADLDDPALGARVLAAFQDAAGYGLHGPRDRARYLNLAATYGWGFDQTEAHAWMRRRLLASDNGPPSERLDALVRECLARITMARERRRLFERHKRVNPA